MNEPERVCEDNSTGGGTKKSHLTALVENCNRFVLSSQLWKNALPIHNCDVVLVLRTKEVADWLLARFGERDSRINFERCKFTHINAYGLLCTARFDQLKKGAELLQLRKKLKARFGGCQQAFVCADAECFDRIEARRHFFTSKERASIVLFMLHSLTAIPGDAVAHVVFRAGEAVIPKLAAHNLIDQMFPLHNREQLQELRLTWVNEFFKPQPLTTIGGYFGDHIAMYFAWLGHYTSALFIPAIMGCLHYVFFWGRNQALDDVCVVSFAFVNILWATLYLESWKRHQAVFAHCWGALDSEKDLLEPPRPDFRGELSRSPVTGRLECEYPEWKRRVFRYFVSYPATLLLLIVNFLVMLWIFTLDGFFIRNFHDSAVLYPLAYVPKVLLAIVISVSDEIFKEVALKLNDAENYRTESEYENALIVKMILFQSVNSFLSLFYIAFVLQDMERLREQLATLLIYRQIVGNVKEAFFPMLLERLKLSRMTYKLTRSLSDTTLKRHVSETKQLKEKLQQRDSLPSARLAGSDVEDTATVGCDEKYDLSFSQAELEYTLPKYPSALDDYLEMYIQFGYVLLFSPAFPLAAIFALVNNIFEIHVDAFKLCNSCQRPFGKQVQSIGLWQEAMEVMGVVGVMVNCALIGYSGIITRLWPGVSSTHHVILVILLEHVVLALKLCIAHAIPDTPQWVKIELAKVEYQRREAYRRAQSRARLNSNHRDVSTSPLVRSIVQDSAQRSDSPSPTRENVLRHRTGVSHL